MSIITEKKGDCTILTVNSQSLAGESASELKAIAVELIDSGVKNIALDLINPEYIDSSGIGKLLFMNKKLANINGKFSIMKINKTLYTFLESLAITKVMTVADPE